MPRASKQPSGNTFISFDKKVQKNGYFVLFKHSQLLLAYRALALICLLFLFSLRILFFIHFPRIYLKAEPNRQNRTTNQRPLITQISSIG